MVRVLLPKKRPLTATPGSSNSNSTPGPSKPRSTLCARTPGKSKPTTPNQKITSFFSGITPLSQVKVDRDAKTPVAVRQRKSPSPMKFAGRKRLFSGHTTVQELAFKLERAKRKIILGPLSHMGVLSEESDESESDQKEEGRDETTTPDSVPVPNLNVQSDQSDDEEDEDESTTHDDMNMQCDEPEGQREEEVEARATDEVPLPIPEVPGLDVLLPCAGGDGDDDVPGDMHSGPDEAEETSRAFKKVSKAKLDAKSNTDEGLLRFFNAASVKQESDTVPEFEEVTDEPAVDSGPETVQLVTETTENAQVPAAVQSATVPEFEVTDEPAVDSEAETAQLDTETTKDAQVPAAVHVDELQDVMDTISAVVGEASQEDIAVRAAKRRAEEAMSLAAADAAKKRLYREHGSENDSDETTDNDDHFDPTYGPGSDSEALEDEFETVKAVEVIKERPKLFQSTPAPVPVAFTPPATSSDKTFRRVVSQPASGERPGGYESGDTSDEENLEPEARIRKRMSRVLNYARKGERRPCRCFHPSCSSKAVYTQRLLRHYMEVHGGREGISKVQAEKLLKQHQPSDLGKVRHMVKERSIIKHLAPLSENKDLLMRLRAFFEEENIAVIKDPKSNGKRTEAVRPPVSPAANEDPLTDEEVVSDISPEALGLNAHCAKTHVLLKLFIEEKSKAAAGAADPKMATANMAGFVSRIISFVESRVKDKKDAFEVLRHPEIHQELINRILKCSLKNAGKANFKRAMDTLIRYCTSGTGPHGQACLTVHPAFPKNDADLTEAIAKVAVIWGRFKAAAPSLTQTHDIADINIDLTDYGEYFTEEARYQKVLQDIETLTSKTADPSNWMKGTNGRYDPEISEGYNAAMRYIAVLLVWKGERGGVATSMTMSELEKANFLEEDELWHVRVAVHKNQKQGPLDVFLTDDEALLFNAFYQLRQRLKMMDESHFASDVLLVGLDGQPGKHIYTDIQKWYDEKKGEATSSKPKFSSRSVRRTQAANAKRFHSKETFSKVARHHNHLESTAESDYVGRSSREAVEDYKTNENVVLNELIAKEAIENSSEWFQFKSATQPLPSRDNVEAVCIAMTKHDSRHFALSTKRYEAILTALKRNLKISTFKWLKRRLRHSKCSMEEALNFLKHDCTLSTDRKITIDFEKYLLESQQPSGKRSNKKIKSEKE